MNRIEPVIEFEHFSFQYRTQAEPTLHDITFAVYPGEKILIAGPSGSGKSTLAHCINGLVPHFHSGRMTGVVRIRGEDTSALSLYDLSEKVGTVLQDPDGQFIGLTVAEDIAFKMENDAIPLETMRPKVLSAAAMVEIEPHLEASPHDLSGGQKQRVTMAGVLTHDADILLFDEPLASLDPRTGKLAVELIDRIARETGKTVIIVEHRLEDVLHRHVDRIILMHEGRIAADLPPADLLGSALLRTYGLREPLYITALSYAGVRISPDIGPEHIDALRADKVQSMVQAWLDRQEPARLPKPGAPLLELRNVTFGFGPERPVVRDVTLTVHRGEMVGVVGKNGAGKSTLSRLVCGFLKPQSGDMKLKGETLADKTVKERAGTVGFVLQNPNQMISKPMIAEEVGFGLTLKGVPEPEKQERVTDILRVCGLYPYRNWPISALSYGQKKRVTIAAILVMEPELLILDEPTAGQDFRHYTEMMTFLERLNQERELTMVMITHDMHLMLEYTNRALVLADGRLIADAHPADVLTDPAIIEQAHLKETSLYTLARKAQLSEPYDFVRRFIEADRKERMSDAVVHAGVPPA